ncbi:MAG TPA: SPOR domain-containing protein, partial [Thermoanaerobaculia bacterium]
PAPAQPAPAQPAPVTTRLERSPSGAATITNASPAGSDPLRSKYDALAQHMAADPVGAYTVQFELVCETASITKAMGAGRSSVWWMPISYRGRPCYRVFWGRFATREEAVKAAAEIPAALHGSAPVVVKIPR